MHVNMPGFTGEESLHKTRRHYQHAAGWVGEAVTRVGLAISPCRPKCDPCEPDPSSSTGCSKSCTLGDCSVRIEECPSNKCGVGGGTTGGGGGGTAGGGGSGSGRCRIWPDLANCTIPLQMCESVCVWTAWNPGIHNDCMNGCLMAIAQPPGCFDCWNAIRTGTLS